MVYGVCCDMVYVVIMVMVYVFDMVVWCVVFVVTVFLSCPGFYFSIVVTANIV